MKLFNCTSIKHISYGGCTLNPLKICYKKETMLGISFFFFKVVI